MGGPEGIAEAIADLLAHTSAAAPFILFFASFVEYVFPPFPGDLLMVMGAWYAAHGELSWATTFVAVTAGALAGAAVDWRIGVWVGERLEEAKPGRFLKKEQLHRFEAGYRRFGPLLIVANRFMPGVRAFLFVAAGASRIPLRTVLLWGGISAAIWNALLLSLGALVAKNLAHLVEIVERYTAVAWGVLVMAGLALLVRALARRRKRA